MKSFRIKFNLLFLWHLSLIVFLFLIVASIVFNVFYFSSAKDKLTIGQEEDNFIPERINEKLLLQLVSDIDGRKQAFQKILLEEPDIKSPFSP